MPYGSTLGNSRTSACRAKRCTYAYGEIASRFKTPSSFLQWRESSKTEGASFVVLIVVVLYGGIVFLVFYVVGVIVSAQGQILKAGLDTSVHTSPFVSNDDKAKIMSLI